MRSFLRIASTGSPSSSTRPSSDDGAGATSGSVTRLSGAPPSTSGVTSATSEAVSRSAGSLELSAAPGSSTFVTMSTDPRTSNCGSSRSVPGTALSVSKGSRGSVTEIISLSGAFGRGRSAEDGGTPLRRGLCGSAEDGKHSLGEQEVQARDQGDDERHEHDHDGRIGDQLAAARPDDLAQLRDHLAQEAAQGPPPAHLARPALLGGRAGAGARAVTSGRAGRRALA